MASNPYKTVRCKSKIAGQSLRWRVGPKRDGFGAVGVSAVKGITAFLPFEISNAVMNGPSFPTMGEAEAFVRGL